ncbi:nucleotide disphospho-sugar-binding domain-containing protein [Streptomonospora salina]|uniref:UDP:flavonoid glycosyltransferase YjiC (YdhE family) n=1 Tax=Streptomonospora salina TaxID=104205 RepID=A0A841EAI5_9ACTN|nr:nucleotide disphospho-sugar-binding domain-containing protein [Streptomonospora salina]MBB6000016.1 UDP:flavonoid glycosyltransferase YjiC (YdhE family) [Streptomonospora salina]
MRALFLPFTGVGQAFPVVPLAWAFRGAGHDVLVATTGDGLAVSEAGLPVVDLAPGRDSLSFYIEAAERRPDLAALQRPGGEVRGLDESAELYAEVTRTIVVQTVGLARSWAPDIIIAPANNAAALVAAAATRVPAVSLGVGLGRTTGLAQELHARLVPVFTEHATGDLPALLNLDVAPPSMLDGPPDGRSMRYVAYSGGTVLPAWLRQPDRHRPRVAITLGTVSVKTGGLQALHALLGSAAAIDAEFVLALGDVDLDVLGELPPNVVPAGWAPLSELLPTCTTLIHHGGGGTAMSALAAGTTQLVLPDGVDRRDNADALHARGVAVAAQPEDVDQKVIEHVMHSTAMSAAAAEVRAEIDTMPPPATLVPVLARLADSGSDAGGAQALGL